MIPEREKLNIIITDDDVDDQKFFIDALDEAEIPYTIKAFKNGRELLNHLEEETTIVPDILFLDLNMPIMNGHQCLVGIREIKKYRAMTIAIYSTSGKEEDIESTFIQGANVYIKKPNDFGVLVEVLRNVLEINLHYHSSYLNREMYFFSL